jgi:hypothetical protein
MNKKIFSKAKLFSWLFIVVAVIGLIFMPLLPWITSSNGENTQIATEATIHEQARPYIAALKSQDLLEEYTSIDMDNMDSLPATIIATIGLSKSLSLISMMFWLCIFFGIFIIIGLALYKLQKRYESLSHIFLLIGCLSVIPAILILVGHLQFILNISRLAAETDSANYSILFYYNYVPVFMGLILFICAILYTKTVLSSSLTFFKQRPKKQQNM